MATFESQERRMPKINECLAANGLESLDACRAMLLEKGIDVEAIVKGVQPICFENAVWAYTLGTAIAVKRGLKARPIAPPPLARAWRPSPCPALWPSSARWAWATATWAPCFCATKPSALLSWQATNRSPLPRAPLALPPPPTRPAKAPARHSERPWQGRCLYHQPHQRLHLCRDRLRLQNRRAESGARKAFSDGERAAVVLWRQRRAGGRCHHEERGCGSLYHRQLHQPHPLPAPGGRHL